MQFLVVRLGKDSVADIVALNDLDPDTSGPHTFQFTSTQMDREIAAGDSVLIWLGSDNSKGAPTKWKQGVRAVATVDSATINDWNDASHLTLTTVSVFSESYDQEDFLEKIPEFYVAFAKYPILGLRSFRNNAVQVVELGPKSDPAAVLTGVATLEPNLHRDIQSSAPNLLAFLNFNPQGFGATTAQAAPLVPAQPGTNKIFYGAPGTGKSYKISQQVDGANAVQTVFHADTTSADFIGSLKPVVRESASGERSITYEFVAGPFTQALVLALRDPVNHYWLVIDEINRAPAAAVFAEIFQLLDRLPDGSSRYSVDFPDHVVQTYVSDSVGAAVEKLHIPGNLSIYASMNSADQAVLPLDTAFKRRWVFEFIPIDFDAGCTNARFNVVQSTGENSEVSWADFALAINECLSQQNIAEDRLLGPFFISDADLVDIEVSLVGKVLLYLWDDVLRHGLREIVFRPDLKTFGGLVQASSQNLPVFSDELLDRLFPAQPAVAHNDDASDDRGVTE